jgi:rubrerythrin
VGVPLFRSNEVLDMAVRIEQQGLIFYRSCMQAELRSQVKKVLEYLIEQEQKHIRVFSLMKQGSEGFPVHEDYVGEIHGYLYSLVKGRVFQDSQKAVRKAQDLGRADDAIEWAIGFEERSILFYSKIKEMMRDSEKTKIDRVIEEEEGHIRRLRRLKVKLRQGSGASDQ